jgi:hypothetical protein
MLDRMTQSRKMTFSRMTNNSVMLGRMTYSRKTFRRMANDRVMLGRMTHGREPSVEQQKVE